MDHHARGVRRLVALQEEVGDALVQIGEDQAPLSEPSIESVQEP